MWNVPLEEITSRKSASELEVREREGEPPEECSGDARAGEADPRGLVASKGIEDTDDGLVDMIGDELKDEVGR